MKRYKKLLKNYINYNEFIIKSAITINHPIGYHLTEHTHGKRIIYQCGLTSPLGIGYFIKNNYHLLFNPYLQPRRVHAYLYGVRVWREVREYLKVLYLTKKL